MESGLTSSLVAEHARSACVRSMRSVKGQPGRSLPREEREEAERNAEQPNILLDRRARTIQHVSLGTLSGGRSTLICVGAPY
jgi:hypothetical protein